MSDNLDIKFTNKTLATKLKIGINVASVNARGLTAISDKRVELSSWMIAHDTDIMCIQEYYIHHEYDKIEFDMSNFINYDLVFNVNNSKTIILVKKMFKHEKIDDLFCNIVGFDLSWLAIFANKFIIIIGSLYHSPDKDYDNIDLNIINEHMEIITERFKNEKRKLCFIINGDMNAKNHIWGSSKTDNRGLNMANWIARNGMNFLNDGSPTYINSTTGKEDVLDLSIISMEFQKYVSRWKIHKHLSESYDFSDHYIMEILFNFNPIVYDIPDRITWNFDEELINDFCKDIKINMDKWKNYYDQLWMDMNKLNQLVELFQLLFIQSCINIFGFKTYNSNNFQWISKKVLDLIDTRKQVKNKLSHLIAQLKKKQNISSTAQLKENDIPKETRKYWKYLKSKINKLDKQIKEKKQKTILESTKKIEKLINKDGAKNDKLFWSISNKLTKTNQNIIPPQRDGKSDKIIATTMEEISIHLHNHFTAPVKRNEIDYQPRHIRFHQKVKNWMKNYQFNRKNKNSILNREYSQQEVLHVINNLNTDSAMAFDFVHFKMIKWCKMEILANLTLLFNLCFNIHQTCPNIWKYGEYIPVPKPGRPPQYAKNIRPIMVIPGFGRIISKLNCNRILTDCVKRNLLSPRNCAFQKNKSTHDITIAMTENLYQSFQNGHFSETSFEDLKSAYDSVWIEGLLYKMVNEYKIDGNMISFIHSQSTNRLTRVTYSGTTTKWKYGQDNLPQGMPDSIALFILLYNNPNINKSKNNDKNNYDIESIYYDEVDNKNEYHRKEFNFDIDFNNFADDSGLDTVALPIRIKLNNKIKRDYRMAMQLAIEDLYDYTRFYQLVVSKIKCSTISFSNKIKFNAYVYKLGNENLELIHSNQHAPLECKHNGRYQYTDGLMRLDENYEKMLKEENGCLDLSNLDKYGEMIENSLNDYPYLDFGKKHNNKNDNSIHNLPNSVRILGIHFDPKLYFNDHLNIVLNKAKYKLYKLQQLAKCKYYKFSSHTIYKLFESVIQPKLEYGLCTIANKIKMKILETFQKKAIKIALGLKKQTPSIYLHEFMYAKTMSFRLDVARIKLWNNYSRAPKSILKHHTFEKWKKYILTNGGNINKCKHLKNRQVGRDELFDLDQEKFNFVSKSPISQAYFLMDKIMPIERKIFRKRRKDVLKPCPIYENKYPSNVCIYSMNKMFSNPQFDESNSIRNNVLWNFYSDGSCMPNPGPGGSAYYSNDFIIQSKIEPIDHDTTINYCEMNGIKMIYVDCLMDLNRFNQRYEQVKYINIFTDSKFVIDQLDINGYPQYQYYYDLINQMNDLANQLNNFNIVINIVKIPSHSGITGNTIVDALAKTAATIANNCKYKYDDSITYNTYCNPINVDISKDLILLKKWYKQNRKAIWIERQEQWQLETLDKDEYIGNMIMQRYMVNWDGGKYIVRSFNKAMRNQLKSLSKFESEIIHKLRSECINLNGYKHFKYGESSGKCIYCNVEETVEHFILKCPGSQQKFVNYYNEYEMDYNIIRNKFKIELCKQAIFFKQGKNFNIINILFPHVWQQDPIITNPKYHEIKKKNKKREIGILKSVVNFVKATKRFKKEKFGF